MSAECNICGKVGCVEANHPLWLSLMQIEMLRKDPEWIDANEEESAIIFGGIRTRPGYPMSYICADEFLASERRLDWDVAPNDVNISSRIIGSDNNAPLDEYDLTDKNTWSMMMKQFVSQAAEILLCVASGFFLSKTIGCTVVDGMIAATLLLILREVSKINEAKARGKANG